jgi:hypothetical protein
MACDELQCEDVCGGVVWSWAGGVRWNETCGAALDWFESDSIESGWVGLRGMVQGHIMWGRVECDGRMRRVRVGLGWVGGLGLGRVGLSGSGRVWWGVVRWDT